MRNRALLFVGSISARSIGGCSDSGGFGARLMRTATLLLLAGLLATCDGTVIRPCNDPPVGSVDPCSIGKNKSGGGGG
jgi:hypothetical protein